MKPGAGDPQETVRDPAGHAVSRRDEDPDGT